MPTPAGGYSRGKRGTHDEHSSVNMPAPPAKVQPDMAGSGKRGVHDSDHSDNTMLEPKEERRNVHQGGWSEFEGKAAQTIDSARGFEPRRSHK